MKKPFTVILTFLALSLPAQVNFSGELKPELIFNLSSSGYDSPLNPDNMLGIGDLMFRNEIHLKLDQSSDTAALDLWLQIGQYPIADMLTASAAIVTSSDPGSSAALTAAVADLAYAAEPYLYTAGLLRASASWMPAPDLKFTLGRQSYLTGYGYGWNPVDLANPPKDPTDPQAYLRGVDGLTLQADLFPWMGIKAYGLLPSQGFTWDYDQLLAGAELTLRARALEVKLSGLYGGVEKEDDPYDLYPHAGGAALFLDLFGLGLYGEGVVRSRSRRNLPDPAGGPSLLNEGAVYSALAGMEYYFNSGLVAAVEYFYNGEGWDNGQRKDYAQALDVLAATTGLNGDYLGLYTPQYFAQHYILLNLMLPWYARDSSFNANLIYSPDSGALFFTPSALFNLNYEGTLVSELWYSGQYSLDDSRKNEVWLSPVKGSILLNLRYYY